MRIFLLLAIKIYWYAIPSRKRRKCIFKISCSQFVYQQTLKEGLLKGIQALKFRLLTCRGGFYIIENPVDSTKMMILGNSYLVPENEIAERLITDKTEKRKKNGNNND